MHPIGETLTSLEIGARQTIHNLSVLPLVGSGPEPGYLTLDEALRTGRFRITEVSEAGHVPELRVVNDLDREVLLLDGEELVGAKQNRVVNLTILVPAKASLTIPVSCVEAGRWHSRSAEFVSAPRAQFAEGRGHKMAQVSRSLADAASYRSNQSDVWSRIGERAARLGADAPTSAMADVFEARHHDVADYVRGLQVVDAQRGAVFGINGVVAGLEVFDAPATLTRLFRKIVASYALDAISRQTPDRHAASLDGDAARSFVTTLSAGEVQAYPGVGTGETLRAEGPRFTAAALAVNGRVVHLAAFRLDDEGEQGEPRLRMRSASARARSR